MRMGRTSPPGDRDRGRICCPVHPGVYLRRGTAGRWYKTHTVARYGLEPGQIRSPELKDMCPFSKNTPISSILAPILKTASDAQAFQDILPYIRRVT